MSCERKVLVDVVGLEGRPIYAPCGSWHGGVRTLCPKCRRHNSRRYPQGWLYDPGDLCPHGHYVGGCGVDFMCPICESEYTYLDTGDLLEVFVNQGWRDARVLAVYLGEALIEYEMPGKKSGRVTSALQVVARRNPEHLLNQYSYNRLSRHWITLMHQQGTTDWIGAPQQQRDPVPFPDKAEYLGCQHEADEDCLICTECGMCRESVDSADVCADCGGRDES